MPRPLGRPSLYTSALAATICDRLADGESLRTICADPAMPCRDTVSQWVRDDRDGFRGRYAWAREEQAHSLAELAVALARSATGPQAGRLQFDALCWYAGKLLPKVYGRRVEIEQTVRAVVSDRPMSLEEWTERYGDTSEPVDPVPPVRRRSVPRRTGAMAWAPTPSSATGGSSPGGSSWTASRTTCSVRTRRASSCSPRRGGQWR